MSLVVRIVNFIVARALNDRQLKALLEETCLAKQHQWADMRKLQREDNLILKTWNELPAPFSTMRRVSVAVLTMFGSTYTYEQSFSHLNNIKTNLRSRSTDESLNACMKLNLTVTTPTTKFSAK
ncbi:hypothetical protein F2P79_019348 [Pimephales promelas]|nr:hypothetical protein F2P79_019348 [Pimephales promelas]